MQRRFATFANAGLWLLAGALGCGYPAPSSQQQQAITNGTVDEGDPAVVALMQDGQAYCSGTLISPAVVLTAAHCLLGHPPTAVFFGTSVTESGQLVPVAEARAHPEFRLTSYDNDVGVVRLSHRSPVVPVAWSTRTGEGLSVGAPVRLVGFGFSESAEDSAGPRKRVGTGVITEVNGQDFKFEPSPSMTCNGDSGGAGLITLDDGEYLGGITMAGTFGCRSFGRDTRVDQFLTDFIEPFVANSDHKSGCGAAGLPITFICTAVARLRWFRRRRTQ